MNRISNRHQLRLIAEVPVTPLLDLVLVLLFVFLVAAPLLKQDVSLAAPSMPSPGAPATAVVLAVSAAQGVKLDGIPVTGAELPAALRKLGADRPETGVVVQVHRDMPVHRLVEIMDLLKAAKIRETAVITTPAGPQ